MKKILVLTLAAVFVLSAPALARTKYDKYGHNIEQTKKVKVQAAAKVGEEEKVKEKTIEDARGRAMGKAVRDGDSNNFTMYDQRGRETGTYVEDETGNGKFYDVRGREIVRTSRQTEDIRYPIKNNFTAILKRARKEHALKFIFSFKLAN